MSASASEVDVVCVCFNVKPGEIRHLQNIPISCPIMCFLRQVLYQRKTHKRWLENLTTAEKIRGKEEGGVRMMTKLESDKFELDRRERGLKSRRYKKYG